ncbi:MAG: transcription elongation factor GreA, partial [Candidatus Paceibacterota bacterium]
MKKYHMTQSGLEKAHVELEALTLRRKEIIEKIKAAKEQGDLKENGEYHEAKNDMAFNESKILELEDL